MKIWDFLCRKKAVLCQNDHVAPGPFQGTPLLKSITASFLHPPYPRCFPKVSDNNTPLPIGVVGPLDSPTVPNVGVLGCNFVSCNLFLHQPDVLTGGLGHRRVESESGRSCHQRRLGSTSCGSFIGRKCYESWVDKLSSHVTSCFHSDVPKYYGPPDLWRRNLGYR